MSCTVPFKIAALNRNVCKFWWLQYNSTLSSTLLGVLCCFVRCFCVSAGYSLLNILFPFLQSSCVFRTNCEKSPEEEVWQVWSGDRGGQRPRYTARLPNNSCIKASRVRSVGCRPGMLQLGIPHLSILSDSRKFSCRKHFLYPELILPVDVLLSYSILPCQDIHWFTESRKRFRCKVMFENEYIMHAVHHVHVCTALAKLVWAPPW
jgi:hypothetical protein